MNGRGRKSQRLFRPRLHSWLCNGAGPGHARSSHRASATMGAPAPVAQRIELLVSTQSVGGSSPSGRTFTPVSPLCPSRARTDDNRLVRREGNYRPTGRHSPAPGLTNATTATKGKASNGRTGTNVVATSTETSTCIKTMGSHSSASAVIRWP